MRLAKLLPLKLYQSTVRMSVQGWQNLLYQCYVPYGSQSPYHVDVSIGLNTICGMTVSAFGTLYINIKIGKNSC